jgi:hypothetical protein
MRRVSRPVSVLWLCKGAPPSSASESRHRNQRLRKKTEAILVFIIMVRVI